MPAAKLRCEYDKLAKIAQVFGNAAENLRNTYTQLRENKELLQDGDWIGLGADKFYAEMDQSILPACQRLHKALEAAQSITTQIHQVLKTAEDDAAAVFRQGTGGAESAPSPAPAASGGSATTGSGGPTAGGTGGGSGGGSGTASSGSGTASGGSTPSTGATPTGTGTGATGTKPPFVPMTVEKATETFNTGEKLGQALLQGGTPENTAALNDPKKNDFERTIYTPGSSMHTAAVATLKDSFASARKMLNEPGMMAVVDRFTLLGSDKLPDPVPGLMQTYGGELGQPGQIPPEMANRRVSTIGRSGPIAELLKAGERPRILTNLVEKGVWSRPLNALWVSEAVKNGDVFKLATGVSNDASSLLSKPQHADISMYARELDVLQQAGYKRVGDYMIPPR